MDSTLTKHNKALLPKPLLLKDYLLDDLNSCSSNGFKSFPRRQCCTTTVRFLIEFDLKNTKKYSVFNKTPPIPLLRNPSKSALSAFQTLIAAVKRLPFAAVRSSERKNVKKTLMKSSFWKRKSNERWKPFDQFLKEKSEPLDSLEIDFTVCSSGKSSSEVNSNLTEVRNAAVKMLKDGDVLMESTTSSDISTTNSSTRKQWPVNEEKEQFSPVSVLDCPFDDDYDISSPIFQHMEGTKKIMGKIHKFRCISQLEPMNLATRFALASTAISKIKEDDDEDEKQAEQKALGLLYTLPSYGLNIKVDHKLLLDFFREKNKEQDLCTRRQWGRCSFEEELLEDAENWINGGKAREMFLGWEVARNRQAFIKDMEIKWRSFDEEIEEVALELEAEVFAALFNELLLDISSMTT